MQGDAEEIGDRGGMAELRVRAGRAWRKYAPYQRFSWLIATSYVKDDTEAFAIYLVLTLATGYGCDFLQPFGSYLYWNALLQVFAVPLFAWLTDRAGSNARVVLALALGTELVLELVLFTSPHFTFQTLLLIQLLRNGAHTQNYNSIWKLFKQKCVLSGLPESQESDIYTTIGMFGIVLEVGMDCVLFAALMVMLRSGASLIGLAIAVYTTTIVMSTIPILIALGMNRAYLTKPVNRSDKFIWGGDSSAADPLLGSSEVSNDVYEDVVNNAESRGPLLAYYRRGITGIYSNPVAFGALFHGFLIYLVWQMATNDLALEIASEHSGAKPTIDNLCGGIYEHLIVQAIIVNALYIIVGGTFIFVLSKTRPLVYFSKVYPVSAVGFAVGLIIAFLCEAFGYTVRQIAVGCVSVIPWFLWRYNTFLTTAACDPRYIGVLTGIIGYIRYLTPVLPGVLLSLGRDDWLEVLVFGVIVVSMIYSIRLARKYPDELEASVAGTKNTSTDAS